MFEKENHYYCVIHVRENFVSYALKLEIRRNASKDLVKEMLHQVAYAPTVVESSQAMEELR